MITLVIPQFDISGLMLKLVFDNLRIKSIPETYN